MSTSDDAERRLAEALRARATGAGRPGPSYVPVPPPLAAMPPTPMPPAPMPPARVAGPADEGATTPTVLLIALLIGIVIGAAIGLMSLLAPGFLPTLG